MTQGCQDKIDLGRQPSYEIILRAWRRDDVTAVFSLWITRETRQLH